MSKRKPLGKKTRFEVFKRDSFTCQYCGKKAPDAVLQVDHIQPVAKGGKSDLLNLITSCDACNSGKSDRVIDDTSAVSKRMKQASALQERREQIEMIAEWQRGLAGIEQAALSEVSTYYSQLVPGWSLIESGLQQIRPFVSKYGLAEVMTCIRNSAASHVRIDDDGKATCESSRIVYRVTVSTLKYKAINEANPTLSALRYIAGIARNRYQWCPVDHRRYIEECHTVVGIPIEKLKQLVLESCDWDQFQWLIREEIER